MSYMKITSYSLNNIMIPRARGGFRYVIESTYTYFLPEREGQVLGIVPQEPPRHEVTY